MTGNRFVELGLTFPIGLLKGAKAATFLIIAGKNTVLTINNRSDKLSFRVSIGNPLLVDNLTRRNRQLVPDYGQHLLNLHDLIQINRCPRVTFDAAGTHTFLQVADKMLSQHLVTD